MKYTEIVFIIDKSGSMNHLAGDTIGGFNGFLAGQKALEGKATLTTVLFDSTYKTIHNGIDINEVKPMTNADYTPGGMTAMLDAIGDTITNVQNRHDELGSEKPEKVLFVITTDGEENSSHKYTKSQIEKMIKHQTNGHGWEFMFLGANMDSVKEAESIGISSNHAHSYDYNVRGVATTYETLNCVSSAIRADALAKDFDLGATYTACADIAVSTNDDSITALSSN